MRTITLSIVFSSLFVGGLSAQTNTTAWAKSFTGTVANVPITCYLQKTGTTYNGYYYYDSKQEPLRMYDDASTGDSIFLRVSLQETDETFRGMYSGGTFKGRWKLSMGDKGDTYKNFLLTETAADPNLSFDIVYVNYSKEAAGGLAKGRNASFDYFASTIWPAATVPVTTANFLKQWVNAENHNKNSMEPIGKLFLAEKNKAFAEWQKEIKATKASDLKDMPEAFTKNTEERILVMYQSDRYLSLADYRYESSGGVQANYGSDMFTLDLKTNKALKMSDILTPAGIKKLDVLLDEAIRTRFHIAKGAKLNQDEGGELMVGKIEVPENFYITGKGIGFNYVPLAIAAYGYGEINVLIPFEKLKGLLQPGFSK